LFERRSNIMNTNNILKKIATICLIIISGFSILAKEKNISIKQIPKFELKDTKNIIFSNKDLNGRLGTLIIFLSNHCKISQSFQKPLNIINIQWEQKGIKLLAISPNYENAILPDELAYSDSGDTFKEMQSRAVRERFNFPYIYDGEKQIITQSLNVKITPSAYLFNSDGILVYSGRIGNHEKPNDLGNSELNQNIEELICGREVNYNRIRMYGTSVKFKKDMLIAENVKKRYASESVQLNHADQRKLKFFLNQTTNYPKFFYVWSLHENSEQNRNNLITISSNFKIFRKRGLKVYTVCVCKEEEKPDALEILKRAQLSALNFYIYGNEISEISKLRAAGGFKITPFCRLLNGDNTFDYGVNGLIDYKKLRISFLNALNKNI
jgi:hypothetical protein